MIRDDFDRQAHDVICMLQYGSQGGKVRTEELHRIGDYLRGRPFASPAIKVAVTVPKIEVKLPCVPIVVQLPK